MGYRDDVDALYERAIVLQRELDQAQGALAQRDAELTRLRRSSLDRSVPPLRGHQTAEDLVSHLVATLPTRPGDRVVPTVLPPDPGAPPALPPPWPPTWPPGSGASADDSADWMASYQRRLELTEFLRGHLEALDDAALLVFCTLIEQLATESARRSALLARLRAIVADIAPPLRR